MGVHSSSSSRVKGCEFNRLIFESFKSLPAKRGFTFLSLLVISHHCNMGPISTMKRKELQKLAKRYGLKANAKVYMSFFPLFFSSCFLHKKLKNEDIIKELSQILDKGTGMETDRIEREESENMYV